MLIWLVCSAFSSCNVPHHHHQPNLYCWPCFCVHLSRGGHETSIVTSEAFQTCNSMQLLRSSESRALSGSAPIDHKPMTHLKKYLVNTLYLICNKMNLTTIFPWFFQSFWYQICLPLFSCDQVRLVSGSDDITVRLMTVLSGFINPFVTTCCPPHDWPTLWHGNWLLGLLAPIFGKLPQYWHTLCFSIVLAQHSSHSTMHSVLPSRLQLTNNSHTPLWLLYTYYCTISHVVVYIPQPGDWESSLCVCSLKHRLTSVFSTDFTSFYHIILYLHTIIYI